MFRTLRSLLTLCFIAMTVWCSFNVKLGRLTFAEHMDRIGETAEAEELLDGTRSVVDPVLDEARDRLLGEYVEAPTAITSTLRDPEASMLRAPPPTPGGSRVPRGSEPSR